MPDPGSVSELTWTAVHEAGHAVIGHVQKLAVLRVSIVPDPVKQTLGSTRIGRILLNEHERALPLAEQNRIYVERIIRMRLAGGAAERRLASQNCYSGHPGDSNDRERAEALVAEFANGDPDLARRMLLRLGAQSIDLVEEHWPQIEALAEELVLRDTLYRNDLIAFLAREERAKRWAQY